MTDKSKMPWDKQKELDIDEIHGDIYKCAVAILKISYPAGSEMKGMY